jgi:predicted branched-subunit amino acid permease
MTLLAADSRAAFMDGVRETLIMAPSYLPFALVCGVAAVNAGLSLPAALVLPGLVYGGSSQAVLTQFLQSASSLWVAVLSGLVVNLRMAV